MIAGLPFGPGEGQGSSRGSNFYHGDLNFIVEFPKGWKIENLQNSVLATSKSREVLIEVTMRDLNRKISAEQLIRRLYGKYKNGQEVNTSEYKGYVATVKIDTRFGKSRKCRVAILYKNKKYKYFIKK
jgi:predicted Zn-dependent protease